MPSPGGSYILCERGREKLSVESSWEAAGRVLGESGKDQVHGQGGMGDTDEIIIIFDCLNFRGHAIFSGFCEKV